MSLAAARLLEPRFETVSRKDQHQAGHTSDARQILSDGAVVTKAVATPIDRGPVGVGAVQLDPLSGLTWNQHCGNGGCVSRRLPSGECKGLR
jgi:hypothetical protein